MAGRKKDDYVIFVPKMGIDLKVDEFVTDDISFVGIHEKYVEFKKESLNMAEANFSDLQKGVFQNTYVFSLRDTKIYVNSDNYYGFKENENINIYFPKDKIFLIKKDR